MVMELQGTGIKWARKRVIWPVIFCGVAMVLSGETMNDSQSEKWNDWKVVNDGVMGGLSQGRAEMTDRDTLLFLGNVSLENNGGFASIRRRIDSFDLGQGEGILLRVKGDGKKYQFRVRTSDGFDGVAYKVDFNTTKDESQDIRLPWHDFTATYRGQYVKDAPLLEPLKIRQIGFLIADQQQGPFELEIAAIEAF
jgi:monofunctional biosynthetic peptidoglycan transglycosylase